MLRFLSIFDPGVDAVGRIILMSPSQGLLVATFSDLPAGPEWTIRRSGGVIPRGMNMETLPVTGYLTKEPDGPGGSQLIEIVRGAIRQ